MASNVPPAPATEEAIGLVRHCKNVLEEHAYQIRAESNITDALNGPQGHVSEGGGRVCGIAVLGYFWCDVAVIFISRYCIAVFRVQAVRGEFKFYIAVVGEKNRCVAVICFFFMTRGYKS